MQNSYLGKEDPTLQGRLLKELPGILNWAIRGRYDLLKDGEISQPESSEHLARQMRMFMAPVGQFFQDCARFHPNAMGAISMDVFERWCEWAAENAYIQKLNITEFERRAIDSNPSLRMEKAEIGGTVVRRFVGMEMIR
jgi:putative DNA primase/helicase